MYNQIFFTNVLRLLSEQGMTKDRLADLAGMSAWFKKAHFWVTRAIGLLPSDQWNFGFPAVIPGGDRLRLLRFAAVEAAPSRGA